MTGYGQPAFKKGFVVIKNSDTLRGYIYYNILKAPLFELRYKSSARTPEIIIPSAEIESFWIKGEGKFIGAPVLLLATDPHEENKMLFKNWIPVIALLKELIKGPQYSLYKIEFEKKRFFICYEDTPRTVEELVDIEIPGYFPNKGFRQQLSALLDSQDRFQEQIGYMEYEEPALKKAFVYLNERDRSIIKSRSKTRRWYVGAGVSQMIPSLGSHFYTVKEMAPCLGVSLTVGYTRPWLGLTEKLISGSNLTLSAGRSRYQPFGADSGFKKNTHDILLATLSTNLSYCLLQRFHYNLYTGLEPYGQIGLYSPTKMSEDDENVWKQIPRKSINGLMLGMNATARIDLAKFSMAVSYSLLTLSTMGETGTLDCRRKSVMVYYYF